MKKQVIKGTWTQKLIYRALVKGFNSFHLKGITRDKHNNVFLLSSLKKMKVVIKPEGSDTSVNVQTTIFGWSPLGWNLIIPSAILIFCYFVGIVPIVILLTLAYIQKRKINKEVFNYLNTIDVNLLNGEPEKFCDLDFISQIERLKQLKKEGILTKREFQKKKNYCRVNELIRAVKNE